MITDTILRALQSFTFWDYLDFLCLLIIVLAYALSGVVRDMCRGWDMLGTPLHKNGDETDW